MKTIIIAFLFFVSLMFQSQTLFSIDLAWSDASGYVSGGKTYYISQSTGSDSNNGISSSTPWKTIDKVNKQTFSPGDSILFYRGDTWHESLVVGSSGNSTAPITFGAYGVGQKPVMSGFTTISGWKNEGNGIYSKVISAESAPNMVTVNGVNTPMGRWPNTGYLTIEACVGAISITDDALSSSPDWDGAEVVIRKNNWVIDRCTITNHTGNSLTYANPVTPGSSSYDAVVGFGYFIQNDLKTLDASGEWYYDSKTSTFYMYFGVDNPTSYEVKVSTINELINVANIPHHHYITFDNLNLQGANLKIINIQSASYITVQNCDISYSGENGIWGGTNGGINSYYFTLRNSTIAYCNNNGITLAREFKNAVIRGNTISNISTIPGMGKSADGQYFGISISYAEGTIIEYNEVFNCGYIPVVANGNNTKVRNNFIHHYCYVKDDGGAIYTSTSNFIGREIKNNIVLNGIGAPDGTPSATTGNAVGIYLDDKSTNVTVTGNTCAHNIIAGIYLHNAHENSVNGNVLFNNDYAQMYLVHASMDSNDAIRNITLNNNIFFAKGSSQYCLVISSRHDDVALFGTADYNYYARPINDINTIGTQINNWGGPFTKRTLTTWQSYTGQDAHSHKSPKSITEVNDLRFEYNATSSPLVIVLPYDYMDVTGTVYTGSITLAPSTSVVLMRDPSTNQPPSIQDQSFQLYENSPNGTVVGTVVASDPDEGQKLIFSIVSKNTNGAFTIHDSTGVISVANSSALNFDFALVVKVQDNSPGKLSSQAIITIHLVSTGIELTGHNEAIKVYPNPVSDKLIIEYNGNHDRLSFEILNSTGQIVFVGDLFERRAVQTDSFSPGVYFLKIEDERTFRFKKIVKI